MSAECSTCGFDLVYPVGTWPIGECQACEDRAALQKAEDVLSCVDEADIQGATEALVAVRKRLREDRDQ